LKQSWLVMLAALLFGLLVSGLYGTLKPRIERNAQEKLNREMRKLLGVDCVFELSTGTYTDEEGQELSQDYYIAKDPCDTIVGYAIVQEGSGFADKIKLLVTFDRDLTKLFGYAVLKTNETPGFGDKIKDPNKPGEVSFKNQFINCPINKKLKSMKDNPQNRSILDEKIIAITGATISSDYVTKIVNEAIARMRMILANEPEPDPSQLIPINPGIR